ncbi:hypothetical protein KVR01_012948 [Diaporthe batatas]|uniref:uncharacterized protein n=1 Tax=Diaporthe batatas TaxID=748121 RepID=UPI001D037D4C|nr:uncharacterized protein KVR01_012948 [Diaporthe batatas]KAG8157240.1 hypothetical protein KVR01_012948 [Diaporthe batatas]
MSLRSPQTASRSSAGSRPSANQNLEQRSYLQQQRLDAYMAEPLRSGNRLVGLSYGTVPTEASRLYQGPSLVEQPQDLRGVGSWTSSHGSR